jgi:hypothetical protein
VGSRVVLGICLRFHNRAPEKLTIGISPAGTNQARGDLLGGAAKEGVGEGWEDLGVGRGGYGNGLCVAQTPCS